MAEPNGTKGNVLLGGLPWQTADEEGTQAAVAAGGKVLTPEHAQELNQAENDINYVNQNWGSAGKFAAGVGSGITLGLGPGLASAAGLVDPNHIQAAQAGSGLYQAGDVAGTLLPALLSGGGSLEGRSAVAAAFRAAPAGLLDVAGSGTERLLGGLLGESAGVLGRAGSTAARMAARGATEGALVNLGHTIGDGLVTNHPLSAESLAASGIDGALFGGLIGGTLGTVGSLGSSAVEAASSGLGKVAGNKGLGVVARRLGMEASDVAEATQAPTGLKGALEGYGGVLEKSGTGAKIGSSEAKLMEGAAAGKAAYTAERNAVIQELSDSAKDAVPSLDRVMARMDTDIIAPRLGSAQEVRVMSQVAKIKEELSAIEPRTYGVSVTPNGVPGEPIKLESSPNAGTWDKWIQSRDQLAKSVEGKASNPLTADAAQVRREVLNIMNSEIDSAISKAAERPGLEGLSQKYASATTGELMADKLGQLLGKKNAASVLSHEPSITPHDVTRAGLTAAFGHPVLGLGFMATKALGKKLMNRMEPAIAQMAYDSSIGLKAATATTRVKDTIQSSVKGFFQRTSKAVPKAGYSTNAAPRPSSQKYDRKAYEEAATRTEQLISANHQDKIIRAAQEMSDQGYGSLAESLMDTNARANQYLLWNMPPRQGTKGLGSLRKSPVSKSPTLQEFKFLRIDRAIKDPLSLLDDMDAGKLSRDAVQAVKYVYPEVHAQIVQAAQQSIYEMKSSGETLPMDKIVSLGMALDAPIDTTLTPEFIGAVQTALTAPAPKEGHPNQGPTASQAASPVNVQALMTPLQQTDTSIQG